MADLTKDEVKALGHAVGLEIQDPDLTEVTYGLNALQGALDKINPLDWIMLNLCPLSCRRGKPLSRVTCELGKA